MKRCIITTLTNTEALRVRQALRTSGVSCEVIRLSGALSGAGCAFGVEISCADADFSRRVLSVSDIPYRKIVTV